jgi:8-oxo-dGTP pyrophosphatase MutT (NUDIX family)
MAIDETLPTRSLRDTVVAAVWHLDPQNYKSAQLLLINQSYQDEPVDVFRLPQGGRQDIKKLWGPGGHKTVLTETDGETARREVREETGLDLDIIEHDILPVKFEPVTGTSYSGRLKQYFLEGFVVVDDSLPDLVPSEKEHVRAAKWFPETEIESATSHIATPESRDRTERMIEASRIALAIYVESNFDIPQ